VTVSGAVMEAIVIFGERVPDEDGYVMIDYHFENGSGFQRLFGTNVILGEW